MRLLFLLGLERNTWEGVWGLWYWGVDAGEEEELSFTPCDSLSKGWKDGWSKMGEELGRGLSFLLNWNEPVSGSETPLGCGRQEDSRLGLNPDSRLLIAPFSQVTWILMLCFVFCKVGIIATPRECTGKFPQSVNSFTVVMNAYHKTPKC